MGDASELKEALVLKEPLVESAAEKPAPESMPRLSSTWKGALYWSGFITIWYLALQQLLTVLVPSVPSAREALLNWVPLHVYHYSEAAFAVATVLNLLNLVFEDSPDKQQLGLLSAVIKGLSWHSDHLIVTGRAVIKYDYHGALFLPSRYVQWSCSTPTMIFTLSRISSMDASSIAATMAADWLMVVTGYMASEMPWWAAVWPLAASFACMVYVLSQLKVMLGDALKEAGSEHARRCLRFTLGSTMVIWCLFPLGWVLSHCLAIPALAAWGEPMTMFANFSAKVVFSTSIMYNNFVTLAQRRKAARVAAEHSERIQAVHDLSVAVGRKDAFLEVVGHELRTPLNAICQLSAALAVGAGGPLGSQARDWMDTIKASAAHLLGVVNDILTFRAGQAAGLVIKQELVSVADVVDEVLRTLLPSAGNGILLEKVLHARLPPIVGDRRRLVLAITNLVANSIKFMDKANGKVTVKAYPDRGGRHVIIKVTDNGPGLTAKQLAQLGDAATLAQFDSGKRRAGGLGLGLPITFQLVAAHGGVVRMSSPGLGQGTCGLIRMPVLQAITDGALEKEFAEAYAAVGYSLEQLLSPELAASEGRACPTFGSPIAPTTATDPMHTHAPAWTAGAPSSNGGRRSSDGNRSSDGTRQVTTFVPSISPGLARALKSNASVNSTSSSFDMSQANVHTYQWCANTQSAYPPNDQAAHHADGGAEDAAIPGRPSEDSLAAWEAYAENMGYTLQPGQSGNLASASPSMNSSGSNALPVSTISAAAGRGVPGSAVALMSSLYVGSNPPSAAALRKPKNKPGVRPNRASNASSTRMSIEEGDEEGQEDEERPSVEVVGTPKRPSVTNYARHSEDAPLSTSVTSSAHSQLLNAAAAAAMASRMGSINPSVNMGQQDSAPVSSSLPTLKGEASGPMYVEAPEWDEYLRTGDGDTGNSNSRMDSDAVVAANARLSLQYQKAVADAAATGGEVDAAWQSWVARIPEHHKVPGASAAKAAAPRPA